MNCELHSDIYILYSRAFCHHYCYFMHAISLYVYITSLSCPSLYPPSPHLSIEYLYFAITVTVTVTNSNLCMSYSILPHITPWPPHYCHIYVLRSSLLVPCLPLILCTIITYHFVHIRDRHIYQMCIYILSLLSIVISYMSHYPIHHVIAVIFIYCALDILVTSCLATRLLLRIVYHKRILHHQTSIIVPYHTTPTITIQCI